MLFGKLLPSEGNFFELFNEHGGRIVEAAQAFSLMIQHYADPELRQKYAAAVDTAERQADKVTAEVSRLLHKTFITPIDRDQIHSLINAMDDIADMLHVALMSSENRAAHALGRYYPGGMPAFVKAMNAKARDLGMMDTHFVEPTGLSSENVSSPRDLVRLLRAASQRPLIHRYTPDTDYDVDMGQGRTRTVRTTNALVRNADWDIKISKTGFINEAGECRVMLAHIQGRDLAIVLLDSQGKYSRVADAIRIRKFVQNEVAMM